MTVLCKTYCRHHNEKLDSVTFCCQNAKSQNCIEFPTYVEHNFCVVLFFFNNYLYIRLFTYSDGPCTYPCQSTFGWQASYL